MSVAVEDSLLASSRQAGQDFLEREYKERKQKQIYKSSFPLDSGTSGLLDSRTVVPP